jgi:hypothetical protein
MRTGEYFARQANQSTVSMNILTQDMHDLATKTKKETVSMHSITVLTLCFLPGTFVAVRYGLAFLRRRNFMSSRALTGSQTFFSTGILKFDGDDSPTVSIAAGRTLGGWTLRPNALKLFLAICLPLMAFVLALWGFAYLLARRQQRVSTLQRDASHNMAEVSEKKEVTTPV